LPCQPRPVHHSGMVNRRQTAGGQPNGQEFFVPFDYAAKDPWVYKYMERRYADMLVDDKLIHVTRLLNFRKEEELQRGIGDPDEGLKSIIRPIGMFARQKDESGRSLVVSNDPGDEAFVTGILGKGNMMVRGCKFSEDYDYGARTMVFCMSDRYNDTVYASLNEKDKKYDTIVRVRNIPESWLHVQMEIMRAIFNECKAKGMPPMVPTSAGIARVACTGKEVDYRHRLARKVHPCLTKPASFEPQKEVRFYLCYNQPIPLDYLDIVSRPLCKKARIVAHKTVDGRWEPE
jgi:hypothetical protein